MIRLVCLVVSKQKSHKLWVFIVFLLLPELAISLASKQTSDSFFKSWSRSVLTYGILKIAGDKRCWKFSLDHRIHRIHRIRGVSWLLFSHGSEIYPHSHSVCESFFLSHRFIYLINKLLARFSVIPFEDFICLADSQVTMHKFSIQAFHSSLAEDRKDWTTWAEGRTYVPVGSPNPDGMNKPTAEAQRERERERGLSWLGALKPGLGMTSTCLETSSSPCNYNFPHCLSNGCHRHSAAHAHICLLIIAHLRSWLHASETWCIICFAISPLLPHPSAVKDICGELRSSSDKAAVMSEAQALWGWWLMLITGGTPPQPLPQHIPTHSAPMAFLLLPPHNPPWTSTGALSVQ